MSSNVYNGKNLNVGVYISASGIDFQDSKTRGKAIAEAPMHYTITNDDGASIDLVGYEAVFVPIAILKDALSQKRVCAGIRNPTPEQLGQLRDLVDKLSLILPDEGKV